MTVTYTGEVATCRGFGCFLKLLFRWRGSIYKLVWLDLLCFLFFYYLLNFTYRWLLDEHGKRVFESIVHYCDTYSDLIPLSFVLGFYVSIVMTRWWNQYTCIPWPDSIAVFVSANIHGQDERGRMMRRTAMRYVCLCLTMVLSMISPRVKKRFPTLDHFIEAGLLLDSEKTIITALNQKFPKPSKHWLPIVWSASIITRARKEGRIRDDFSAKTVIDELNKFRGQCGLLISYDTISVPLVYTQVVTLAVYSYFLTSIMARQWIENKPMKETSNSKDANIIDVYFPIFTTLQFFFYMGWLKVAESLINPFGEDDDDFEVNWMIDRNLQVAYLIVDEMHHEHPELIRDQYWDEVFPTELPYTVATENQREEHPLPSTAKIEVPEVQREMVTVTPSAIKIDEMDSQDQSQLNNDDAVSGIHFSASGLRSIRRKPSIGSSLSVHSNANASAPNSLPRVASVTQMIKRLFSRDDTTSRPGSQTNPPELGLHPDGASGMSVPGKFGGSMRITDQIIEELDEQNTITSMATKNDPRPHAATLFGPPQPSAPVNMPSSSYSRTYPSDPPLAGWDGMNLPPSPSSPPLEMNPIPSGGNSANFRTRSRLDSDIGPSLSAAVSQTLVAEDEIASTSTSTSSLVMKEDGFDRLKSIRDKERIEKYQQKLLARSVSAQQNIVAECYTDNDMLLSELTKESRQKSETLSEQTTEEADAGATLKKT
ncbi:bestrophin-4-like isoform X2 [Arctopsyche grandis]|uniref:bestrophin-4-like isoform X2 n=1 Tax=Arctopsyche grandis TaxID=121162 RepID=UPI00406D9678